MRSGNLPSALHTAVVGTVRPLLGSRQNGQSTLYPSQKYLLCWEHKYIVSRNKIDSVKKFHLVCSFTIYFCYKFLTIHTSLHSVKETALSCEFYDKTFWNAEKTGGAARAVLPPHQLPFSSPRCQGSSYLTRTIFKAYVMFGNFCRGSKEYHKRVEADISTEDTAQILLPEQQRYIQTLKSFC
jgi:hypothetical protein